MQKSVPQSAIGQSLRYVIEMPQSTKPSELSILTPNGKTQLVKLERDRY